MPPDDNWFRSAIDGELAALITYCREKTIPLLQRISRATPPEPEMAVPPAWLVPVSPDQRIDRRPLAKLPAAVSCNWGADQFTVTPDWDK